jgi:hypothetical protein
LGSEVEKAQDSWTWSLELAANRAVDRLAWARLPVVPKFRVAPIGFVPALAATWMTPAWLRHGCAGYNFWTMARPESPGGSSGRYDPDHPLFQAWICVYVCRRVPLRRPLFGYTRSLEPVPSQFAALGRVDQKAWLWLKGAEWAPVRVREISSNEPAAVGETKTRLVRSRMSTHADVGFDNPHPSPLRVDFRPPDTWPSGLTQGSFAPQEGQWRGKIRPYQSIEYEVHGFPIALQEHGLSAYLFYAGAKYERDGKTVDNLENVRAAAAPILDEGIDFVKRSGEPAHGPRAAWLTSTKR